MDRVEPSPADEGPASASRASSRRVLWHLIGVLLAAMIAWLVLLAYRQPEFLLDLTNLRLC
ncbi:MAG: hypothetical protein IT516_11635 [Burkholderiales bacterium]|nr:hypothetical protein [Burkholderiales bacterium]